MEDPLTARDAAAGTFSHAFTLDIPRDPSTWPVADPRPVPQYIEDALGLGKSLSTLGKAAFEGIRAYAEQHNIHIEGPPTDLAEIPPGAAHRAQLPCDLLPPTGSHRYECRHPKHRLTRSTRGPIWSIRY